MIALVDYGLGNIQAFANIYRRLNIPVTIASTPEQLACAGKVILPGVGAFDWAMGKLNASGLRACLDELAGDPRVPVLGVCVGMQIMAHGSEEGDLPGLGWIDADVKHFDEARFQQQTHLPHMGWNDIEPRRSDCLFKGIESPRYYFLHSYYIEPRDAALTLAESDYTGKFACAIRFKNLYGTQFHPEKSHNWGIQLLKNFAEL